MYCPNCKKYCSDCESFCSECGYAIGKTQSTAKAAEDVGINFGRGNALKDVQINSSNAAGEGGINFGRANALKDVQINSSHTDNSIHNINYDQRVIYERQKSQEEITAEHEGEFMQSILSCLADGILDQDEYINLKILAKQKGISDARAQQLIDEMRNNVALKNKGGNNSFIVDRTIREIQTALSFGNCDILKGKLAAIEQLANNINDNDIQFYSNMLYASLNPESCLIKLMNTRIDSYWQQFWTCIAYFKCGKPESAAVIMSRLGGYGFPIGNLSLLMAISSLAEYRKNPMQSFYAHQVATNLDEANSNEISEELIPLWLATQQAVSDSPQVRDSFRFYYEVTLKEMCTMVAPKIPDTAFTTATAPELPHSAMKSPAIPQIDPQDIQLPQMQGFNPLKAFEQMMTTPIGTMQMPSMPPMGVPPVMPDASTLPPLLSLEKQ